MKFHYDLHIHSCLSPCGDAESTPADIAGMAKLKGLDVIALTDHNACGNCAAVMEAGRRIGLLVLPGMELTTAEDIHIVCLFASLADALAFEAEACSGQPKIANRPDLYGPQQLMSADDEPLGTVAHLLLVATGVPFDGVFALAARHGGVAFPAHADRPANSVIDTLGALPPEACFTAVELSRRCADADAFLADNPSLRGLTVVRSSDAHTLGGIAERGESGTFDLPALSAEAVIAWLAADRS